MPSVGRGKSAMRSSCTDSLDSDERAHVRIRDYSYEDTKTLQSSASRNARDQINDWPVMNLQGTGSKPAWAGTSKAFARAKDDSAHWSTPPRGQLIDVSSSCRAANVKQSSNRRSLETTHERGAVDLRLYQKTSILEESLASHERDGL